MVRRGLACVSANIAQVEMGWPCLPGQCQCQAACPGAWLTARGSPCPWTAAGSQRSPARICHACMESITSAEQISPRHSVRGSIFTQQCMHNCLPPLTKGLRLDTTLNPPASVLGKKERNCACAAEPHPEMIRPERICPRARKRYPTRLCLNIGNYLIVRLFPKEGKGAGCCAERLQDGLPEQRRSREGTWRPSHTPREPMPLHPHVFSRLFRTQSLSIPAMTCNFHSLTGAVLCNYSRAMVQIAVDGMPLSTCMLEQHIWASRPCGLQVNENSNLHTGNPLNSSCASNQTLC